MMFGANDILEAIFKTPKSQGFDTSKLSSHTAPLQAAQEPLSSGRGLRDSASCPPGSTALWFPRCLRGGREHTGSEGLPLPASGARPTAPLIRKGPRSLAFRGLSGQRAAAGAGRGARRRREGEQSGT